MQCDPRRAHLAKCHRWQPGYGVGGCGGLIQGHPETLEVDLEGSSQKPQGPQDGHPKAANRNPHPERRVERDRVSEVWAGTRAHRRSPSSIWAQSWVDDGRAHDMGRSNMREVLAGCPGSRGTRDQTRTWTSSRPVLTIMKRRERVGRMAGRGEPRRKRLDECGCKKPKTVQKSR